MSIAEGIVPDKSAHDGHAPTLKLYDEIATPIVFTKSEK